ncbi:MAG: hypothetical protein H6Q41_1105 [Deltaproteobacteria bacterium]|jgi:hypothetical protein|nr:hypothetical protein [Deltaproteobacteria bacterium]
MSSTCMAVWVKQIIYTQSPTISFLPNNANLNNFHFYYCLNLAKKGRMVYSTIERNKCYNELQEFNF